MDIYLYKMNEVRNMVYKSSYMTLYAHLEGVLREESSIINPVVVVQLETEVDGGGNPTYTEASAFNYAYIPQFKRYYFVEDVVSVANKLWRLHLHVDVLMSFESDFVNSTVPQFCERADPSVATPNAVLDDPLMSFSDEESVTYTDLETGSSSIKNITFDPAIDSENDIRFTLYNFVTQTNRGNIFTWDVDHPQYAPWVNAITNGTTISLPTISPSILKSTSLTIPYACNTKDIAYLQGLFGVDGNYTSYVAGAIGWPFKIPASFYTTAYYKLGIGDSILRTAGNLSDYTCNVMKHGAVMPYLVLCDFTSPTISDFRDMPPHASYELYVPYYGFVPYDVMAFQGHKVVVYYSLSLITGGGAVFVYDDTDDKAIFTAQVQVGFPVNFDSDNSRENLNEQNKIILNSVLAGIGGVFATAGGLLTGNPLVAMAGVGTVAGAVAKGTVGVNSLIPRGSVSFSGDTSTAFSPTKCYLKKTVKKPAVANGSQHDSYIKAIYGRPVKDAITLKSTPQKHGFVMLSNARVLSNVASATELKELETILNTGFYL